MPEATKDDVFVVFFAEEDNDIKFSLKEDPNYKKANMKSAIKDRNTFRGFNLSKLNQMHRISQGFDPNNISKMISYYAHSDRDSEEVPLSYSSASVENENEEEDDDTDFSTPIGLTAITTNYLSSYKNEKSEVKTKFDVSEDRIDIIFEDNNESEDDKSESVNEESEADEPEESKSNKESSTSHDGSESSDDYTQRQQTTSRMHRKLTDEYKFVSSTTFEII